MKDSVKVWKESINIPTYGTGTPEKNPMFLEKRVYQGSSGVVYPHPVIEKIYDDKKDKSYQAVFMENDFVRVMILPELGGRIQMAFDKIRNRHFIYYNQVIKPALVGLTGPWISGGIEFNWPQHHRPSTFEPVDCAIEENADGSKTVWVNEVERMFRTKGRAGFTLYPGKAYIEIKGKLYNRTPLPQTFLWWANPAVKVNDEYQSVFPPDVYAVFDHGKRDVSSFPIATGTYYKVNYAPGTDISRYRNIPVPTSYMAVASKYDFIGGYEHDTKAGLLHVADHHIAPGKKQWTWGNGDFGKAWDRNLTDEDGPYIELMTGVFTDNQPDFSWIKPYEEKSFVQYFMPYAEVGLVKNASKDAVIGMELTEKEVLLKCYVTARREKLQLSLRHGEDLLYHEETNLPAGTCCTRKVAVTGAVEQEKLSFIVKDAATGEVLVSYRPEKITRNEIPSPAEAAKRPEDIENNEQLYLTGLHIEQYRHATYSAKDYYEEALRRDENDARNNNALGLWYLRRGKFNMAEKYFRKSVATLTQRNPNPYDSEPFYNLGWALKLQGRTEEAYDAFFKSAWGDECQPAGYLNLARIATGQGQFESALELIEKSLIKNYHSHTARHAKAFILRKMGRTGEALDFIRESLGIDLFNYGCLFEKYLLLQHEQPAAAAETAEQLRDLSRNWPHNYIEYALDYAHAGLFIEAARLLQLHHDSASTSDPMVLYYLGWLALQEKNKEHALEYFNEAASQPADFCFPNRIEDINALQSAISCNPADSKAYYYLGNLWYDKRQYEDAIGCWEKSASIDSSFPTVRRNLALAYYNKRSKPLQARAMLEQAFALDPSDGRILMELDQLYKKLNVPPSERLALLEAHLPLVEARDDLYLERVTLYNQLREYRKAKELIAAYKFHPWEGGEGKVVGQYLVSHIELAKAAISSHDPAGALALLDAAATFPENLGEGKLFGAQENDINYLKGVAYSLAGDHASATQHYHLATRGITEPVQAIFYNDPQPDKIFYQGLAWIKLGESARAEKIFHKLISFGRKHIDDKMSIDYFAVSLPDMLVFDMDLTSRNKIHCLYLMALGNLGLGIKHYEEASRLFDQVLSLDINHLGAQLHRDMIGSFFANELDSVSSP